MIGISDYTKKAFFGDDCGGALMALVFIHRTKGDLTATLAWFAAKARKLDPERQLVWSICAGDLVNRADEVAVGLVCQEREEGDG